MIRCETMAIRRSYSIGCLEFTLNGITYEVWMTNDNILWITNLERFIIDPSERLTVIQYLLEPINAEY